jgi:hypothetical protein
MVRGAAVSVENEVLAMIAGWPERELPSVREAPAAPGRQPVAISCLYSHPRPPNPSPWPPTPALMLCTHLACPGPHRRGCRACGGGGRDAAVRGGHAAGPAAGGRVAQGHRAAHAAEPIPPPHALPQVRLRDGLPDGPGCRGCPCAWLRCRPPVLAVDIGQASCCSLYACTCHLQLSLQALSCSVGPLPSALIFCHDPPPLPC